MEGLAAFPPAAGPVAVSIVAVLGSRALLILGPPQLLAGRLLETSRAERGVLVWGGLRGALTITLALALPPGLLERQLLIAMAFGVVLFSLLIQGLTLSTLVKRVGLAKPDQTGRG